MNVPTDLLYTDQHEWISVDEEIATVGITDYAQGELGDIVFVELPQVGDPVEQMEAFGTIEAVKTVADLFAPVSGEVVEVNHKLGDSPALINQDPYGEGWMIKIRVRNKGELADLLAPPEYRNLIS